MRQHTDVIEVRRSGGVGRQIDGDAPDQFLWQGRLWQVRDVLSSWIEEGAWWVRSPEEAPGASELIFHREVWRVVASRGRDVGSLGDPGCAVFDLTFDPGSGRWGLAVAG